MLKTYHSMEEEHAGEALRQLLARVPIIQNVDVIHEPPLDRYRPDLVFQARVDDREHLLFCEYKSNGQPRYARSALLQLRDCVQRHAPHATPVFIAPYLSPAVRQLCDEYNASYIDLQGNAKVAFAGVYIERVVASAPAAARRELKSLFRPKSAQVLRTMLGEPGRTWRVAELAEDSGVSLGHVSNVDVDVSLNAQALGNGEYATLIGAFQSHGYAQSERFRRFQLVREVPMQDGGARSMSSSIF